MNRIKTKLSFSLLPFLFLAVLCAGPSCTEDQLGQVDKVLADTNQVGTLIHQVGESPAAAWLPPEIRVLMELLGLGAAGALTLWQRIRASKILEAKQDVTTTLKAVIDGVQAAGSKADPVKAEVKRVMQTREIFTLANAIVDQLKTPPAQESR